MKTTTLGADGPETSAIGLGCMGMSWAYGTGDDATSIDVIHRAIDLGVTLLDTADVYGPYANEQLVGRALRGRRDEVLVATKVGLLADGARGMHVNGRPEYLRGAVEGSLARLGVDAIDLYQLHRADPRVPLEETWGALAELVEQGKVVRIGLSEVGVDQIRQAHAIHPVTSVQSELSLWTRDVLDEVLPFCQDNGIGFLPFSPLGRGFLTGTVTSASELEDNDFRRTLPRFEDEALQANFAIVDEVRAIAQRLDATPGQVALAWVRAQGDHVVPIPGTKRMRYLEENVAAADLDLPAAALAQLDALPAPVGDRYGTSAGRSVTQQR